MCNLNPVEDKTCWSPETWCLYGSCGTCHGVKGGHGLSSPPGSFLGIELEGQRQEQMLNQAWSPGTDRWEARYSAWKSLFVGVLLGLKSGTSSPAQPQRGSWNSNGLLFPPLVPMDCIEDVIWELLWAVSDWEGKTESKLNPPPPLPPPCLLWYLLCGLGSFCSAT